MHLVSFASCTAAVEEDSADDSGISDDDSDTSSSDKPKRTEIVPQWDLLNGQKAIWLRSPKDVELEEYKSFYAALSQVQPPPPRFCYTAQSSLDAPVSSTCSPSTRRAQTAGINIACDNGNLPAPPPWLVQCPRATDV